MPLCMDPELMLEETLRSLFSIESLGSMTIAPALSAASYSYTLILSSTSSDSRMFSYDSPPLFDRTREPVRMTLCLPCVFEWLDSRTCRFVSGSSVLFLSGGIWIVV